MLQCNKNIAFAKKSAIFKVKHWKRNRPMAKSPNTASKSKPAQKAAPEVHAPEAATKMLDDGMEKFTGMASKFGSFAEDSLKTATERAAASTEIMRTLGTRNMDFFTRTLGTRNMDFFTRTLEQGAEATQALTSAKDPRKVMEIQSAFAKSLVSAYTSEMNAQAELCMLAWRDAAKPFTAWTSK